MPKSLIYTPIFRFRQEEKKVLLSFDFGARMYPLVEIIKEAERKSPKSRKGKAIVPKVAKPFNKIYLPILEKIKANKIFVDLPVHMKDDRRMKDEVLTFLRKVVANRIERTSYIISLKSLSSKVIPIISTYSQRSGEVNTIIVQENDLRPYFNQLAFRTFPKTFKSDLKQIDRCVQKQDFLILDLDDYLPDPTDEDIIELTEQLKDFNKCHVIIVRSAINTDITNVGLDHGKLVEKADNSLLKAFRQLEGDVSSPYI